MPRYANITPGTISILEMVDTRKTYKLVATGEDFECSAEVAQRYIDRGRIKLVPARAPFTPRQ